MIRELPGKLERACDRLACVQLLAIGIDRSVARRCRAGMRCVIVGRAFVLSGRFVENLILEQKVREVEVDRRRIGVRRE